MADRIVVLGNGPSLADTDLKALGKFPTIGMNAAYRYWDRIDWYPTYYACLDNNVVASHQDQIYSLIKQRKCSAFFLHQNILETYPELAARPDVYILSSFLDDSLHAAARAKWSLPVLDFEAVRSRRTKKITTGVMATRFAAYLGYRRFLLLGIDANYTEIIPEAASREGITLEIESTPATNPNYFFADYQQAGDRYNLPTPPTYDGNMHLDVFKVAREDLAELKQPAEIWIGTKKSKLFEERIFDYRDRSDFLEDFRPRSLPDKKAPLPDYVPRATSGLQYEQIKAWGGIQASATDEWEWVESNGQFDGNAVAIVFSKKNGFNSGDVIEVAADISSASPASFRIRLCRDGTGPFEMSGSEEAISAEARRVILEHTIREPQPLMRFEISSREKARVRIRSVVARMKRFNCVPCA